MATVSFIRYSKQSRGTLSGVKQYVEQEKETLDESLGLKLVSGQNCSPQFAAQEFSATRNAHHKDSPVWFYHYTQSFHPNEAVTGKTAHDIAKEFAARAWPDSEVLIATHMDADHIHSHFIVSAVCFESGKMLRQGPNTLNRLRQLSDEICQAHGLSVLPTQRPRKGHGMTGREYRSAARGESWKFRLMNTIDQCMRRARTQEEFIQLMRGEGYDVRWTNDRKHITYTAPNGMKCRDTKLHDEKYLKENMEYEFTLRQALVAGQAAGVEQSDANTNASTHHSAAHRTTTAAGTSSQPSGVGTAGPNAGRYGPSAMQADGSAGANPGAAPSDPDADGRGGSGAERDQKAVETGWEKERAALLTGQAAASGTQATGLADGVLSLDAAARIGSDLVWLGRAIERSDQPAPVTSTPTHSDRKALAKERQKKMAQGQKFTGDQQHTITM